MSVPSGAGNAFIDRVTQLAGEDMAECGALSRYTGSMVSLLRRYRLWLLSLIALSGLASWSLWPNGAGRVMRARYERIHMGMTSENVKEVMGGPRSISFRNGFDLLDLPYDGPWKLVAMEPQRGISLGDYAGEIFGLNGPISIEIYYLDNKVVCKEMRVRITAWEGKVRDWLAWLGL
jgi:hypothetical protein